MGEIKSTLDLVLEKTKHLTLSKEEKEEHKYHEVKKSLKGLIQKFLDKAINLEQLKKELNQLRKTSALQDDTILLKEITGRITLDQDNRPLLILLKEICNANVIQLEAIFDEYQNSVRRQTRQRKDEIINQLAKNHLISGSAVVPNLDGDDTWMAEVQGIRDKYDQMLSREVAGLKGGA